MRNEIQKILFCVALVTVGLLTQGCTKNGFSADSFESMSKATSDILPGSEDPPSETLPDDNPNPLEPIASDKVSFSGKDAEDLFAVLQRAGLANIAWGIGSTTYLADEIICNTPVVPNSVTTCEVYSGSSLLHLTTADTTKVKAILAKYLKARNPDAFGTTIYKAFNVTCSTGTNPGESNLCTLSANQELKQPLDSESGKISVTGKNAEDLFAVFQRAGIVDASGRLGTTTLQVSELECMKAYIENSLTICRVYTTNKDLELSYADGAKVILIMSRYLNPIESDHVIALGYVAYNISCSKVVAPGSIPTCTLSASK